MLLRIAPEDIGQLTHIDAASARGCATGCRACRAAPSTAPIWDCLGRMPMIRA
jgi:hypothetical protein